MDCLLSLILSFRRRKRRSKLELDWQDKKEDISKLEMNNIIEEDEEEEKVKKILNSA